MKQPRIYVDSSVLGGPFDPEFMLWSTRFFREFGEGRFLLIVSDLVAAEVSQAPQSVREHFLSLPEGGLERTAVSPEAIALRDHYLAARILSPRHANDALHVALATTAEADILTSWNFRHLVHFEKARQFNAVNLSLGFRTIEIRSPREIIHEDEDV